ncbi:TPA: carbon storage regulator [Legionella pneumophila subsp. pneumophila]|nr:carbon storage regulator [Legionella pneumophila subsp. pneumophila]
MLTLIRRIGEEIYIDKGRIKVRLLSEKDGLVRVGIEAPKDIDVDRKEVFIRKAIKRYALTYAQASTSSDNPGGDHA